jgi:O-acetyl-ADP-ribose deacetylase (regulator of RNase III)
MIHLVLGRIENQDTDIIVNSTNAEMVWEETTVNGDIHNAAGKGFTNACEHHVKVFGKLKMNDVFIITGYKLKASFVLNVYPPFYEISKTPRQNYDKIFECYKKCFKRAQITEKPSITFPLIGAGTFMYPHKLLFGAFLSNAMEWEDGFEEIRMSFIDENVLNDCKELLKEVK